MSDSYYLVCHETQQRVWVGQGWGTMEVFYSDHGGTERNALHRFLCDHIEKSLVLINRNHWTGPEDIYAYHDYDDDDRLNRVDKSFRVL